MHDAQLKTKGPTVKQFELKDIHEDKHCSFIVKALMTS